VTNISTKILADSITEGGHRLTTFELTYPRFIHSELLTHRTLSRNSASSRAIPAAKLRERVLQDQATPVSWGKNQKGMQANEELSPQQQVDAAIWWRTAKNAAVDYHIGGEALGLHKQIVNRIIEPWMMITVICSATEWANFFALRRHKDAEPNFQVLANAMWANYIDSKPVYKKPGEWHLPMLDLEEWDGDPGMRACNERNVPNGAQVSAGRCARVSYLTHAGVRDPVKDIALCEQLAGNVPMHASPLEHPAVAVVNDRIDGPSRYGNFIGWKQLRYFYQHQAGPDVSAKCSSCGLWPGTEPAHTKGCEYA
jgi:hypothetical protein